MLRARVNIVGGEQGFERAWSRITNAFGKDLREPLKVIQKWWYGEINRNLKAESDANGRWPELSEDYVEWKERNYGPLPMLYLNGAMRKALTGKSPQAGEVTKRKKMKLFTTGIPYVFAHNFGVPKKNLPKREFLYITSQARKRLDGAIRRFILQQEKELGVKK